MSYIKRHLHAYSFVALFFSIALVMSFHVVSDVESNALAGVLGENGITPFSLLDACAVVVLTITFSILLGCIARRKERISAFFFRSGACEERLIKPFVFISVCSALLFLAWLPYLIECYPGSLPTDAFESLRQAVNGTINSNHHPVAYTLLVGFFVKLAMKLGGDLATGVFLYSLFQMAVMSGVVSYLLNWMRIRLKTRTWFLIVCFVFFAFFPPFPTYSITMWKDPLFSLALLMMSLYLLEEASSKEALKSKDWKSLSKLVLVSLAIAFLRNNGIYVLGIVALILLLCFKSSAKSRCIALGCVIAFNLIITGPVYDCLHVKKPNVEAFSLPIQQIAYVMSENPESVDPASLEVLDSILPVGKWADVYHPYNINYIKWDDEFNEAAFEQAKLSLLKVWVKLFPSNIENYINSWLLATLGFWHPYLQVGYGYTHHEVYGENDLGVEGRNLIREAFGSDPLPQARELIPRVGTGTLLWISLACFALCLYGKKDSRWLFYVPGISCALILFVATPVAFSLRYAFILLLAILVYTSLPFAKLWTAHERDMRKSQDCGEGISAVSDGLFESGCLQQIKEPRLAEHCDE